MSNLSGVAEPQRSLSQAQPSWMYDSATKLERELTTKYGEQQRVRLERGLHQVLEFWREQDGDSTAFEEFVRANFAGDQATLDTIFNRYQSLLEQIPWANRRQLASDLGELLARYLPPAKADEAKAAVRDLLA